MYYNFKWDYYFIFCILEADIAGLDALQALALSGEGVVRLFVYFILKIYIY